MELHGSIIDLWLVTTSGERVVPPPRVCQHLRKKGAFKEMASSLFFSVIH